jgi:competence protein ComFC
MNWNLNWISKKVNQIFDFFFPKTCIICSSEGLSVCTTCFSSMEKCEDFEIFDGIKAFSCFKYNEISGKIIKDLKYNGRAENAKEIAEMLYEANIPFEKFDFIIPVGTSFLKRVIRKYNAPNLIANHLNKRMKKRVLHSFFGKKFFGVKKSQVGLSRFERMENLKNAFYVKSAVNLEGKRILLIDDVITTGATVRTCVKEISKFNPSEIIILSFARRDLS